MSALVGRLYQLQVLETAALRHAGRGEPHQSAAAAAVARPDLRPHRPAARGQPQQLPRHGDLRPRPRRGGAGRAARPDPEPGRGREAAACCASCGAAATPSRWWCARISAGRRWRGSSSTRPTCPACSSISARRATIPKATLMSHIIGYTGRVSDEDLNGRDDPLLSLPTMRFGKKGMERALEDDLRGRAGARPGRGQCGRPRGARARPQRGPARRQRAAHHRSRAAALRRRAAGRAPERLGGGDGRDHRRRHRADVDAGLRSQHLRPRHHPERMARAARKPGAAAPQQVDRRRLSAGLDLQDGDGAGGAGIQGDRAAAPCCPAPAS